LLEAMLMEAWPTILQTLDENVLTCVNIKARFHSGTY
jgi:hypothetical protein